MNNNRISTSTHHSSRVVLDGVPRIGYDIHLCPFPGTLDAYCKYLGDPQDYDYLMGITGAPFRRLWNRDDGGNVGILRYEDEPFRQAFAALGYEWHTVPADAEKETMIAAIKASLAQGRPVISFGIIGPPEPGLVTGYDEDGAVLYGWSYFQEQREHYYETRDWFETMDKSGDVSLLTIGDRQPTRPSAREVFLASLQWALDLERTAHRPNLPDHLCGLAAYDGWADALEVDADYPADDGGTMGTRIMVYGDQCVMVEERHEAARFLRRMKGIVPQAADHLEAAAALYDQVGDRVTPLWPWSIDPGAGARQALADAHARRELAGHVRAARDREAEAVTHLERALAALS
ncbi:MAG: hypothetical protein JSV36_02095 [Anaerolineae bacterium]|nr:MAG: hypothetical protein JSV36_02095 [Anaerolineae bacterium]